MEAREAMSTPPAGSAPEELQARRAELARPQQALQDPAALRPVQSADPLQRIEELRGEIEALRHRQDAYEPRLSELAVELAGARDFRERAEAELSTLQMSCAVLAAVLDEMTHLPADVRSAFEPELSEVRGELQRQLTAGDGAAAGNPVPSGEVAASGPLDFGQSPPRELVLPRFARPGPDPAQRSAWLARAIEAIAAGRSPALAADLIGELLPLHATLWDGELAYRLETEERGELCVRIAAGKATVTSGRDEQRVSPAFRLRGSAAAFASLAGGGAPARRPAGVRVRGSRRAARGLFAACARPVALADLLDAGVSVWPGLLLAALAEAVDPLWTKGSSFTVVYEIEDAGGAAFHVAVRDGAPISVTAARPAARSSHAAAEGAAALGEQRADATALRPQATIRAGEHAFLAMMAGVALPAAESVLIAGEDAPALELLHWFARAQGLVAAPADA